MLKKLLGFDPQTMALRTEIIAGITTFLTMSYILAVNPSILATTGMDKGAVFTATALASALATLLLAFMAKLPFAQAPSMALNAFFAFTLVQGMGYSWQTAMTAMFVEGVIFILITFLNVREVILNSIPMNLRFAISAGDRHVHRFCGFEECRHHRSKSGDFRDVRTVHSGFDPGDGGDSVERYPGLEESEGSVVLQHSDLYVDRYSVRSDGNSGWVPACFYSSFDGSDVLPVRF